MSIRSKRLAAFLEKELGWQVYDDAKRCLCGKTSYGKEAIFCSKCGLKLKNNSKPTEATIAELEKAISFALKDNK